MSLQVLIEADGGSRGNPGPAGYGAVVRDADTGELLAERSGGLGSATNNVAEYTGLIEGLRAAVELGAAAARVQLDSKLVVEQMCRRWRVKQPHLQPLADEAARIAGKLERVGYTWVPRERNQHADRLANEAMDTQAGVSRTPAAETAEASEASEASEAQTEPAATWAGATGNPTRMLLLRHGETEHSAQLRYSGRGDPELTDLGRRQARAGASRVATRNDVAAVITSPLSRARHTAELAAGELGVALEVRRDLIEMDFGEWEGLTFTEARRRDPVLHGQWLADTSVPAPGGESVDEVCRRVAGARDELVQQYHGATVVLVSHVTPIKSLLRIALAVGPSLMHRLYLDLASLSIAEFYPDGPASVTLVNDTSHL